MRVLFLCSDNAARSQMAEALLRSLGRGHFTAFSAGAEQADAVDQRVFAILKLHQVSSDGLRPKHLRVFEGQPFDYVIAISDPTWEQTPSFAGADVMHWSFADPAQHHDGQTDPRAFETLFAGLARRIRLLMVVAERREREHASQATQASAVPGTAPR
jgi:ArsR family transcriptional regulator, arsenate/arsenite/antimonite-responsive transcriptional repressor / arsenate reductase (thioredoxin)